MSHYLQRLAQRSGLVAGASVQAGSPGSVSAAAPTSRSAPADDGSPAGIDMDGAGVINRLRVVPQPVLPPEAGSSTHSPAARTTDGGQHSADRVEPPVAVHPLHRDSDAGFVSGQPMEKNQSIDSIAQGSRTHGLSAGRSPDDSGHALYGRVSEEREESFDSSSGSTAISRDAGTNEPALSVAGTETSILPTAVSAGEHPADLKPATAPPQLIDQAIQWVMDDPHWKKQADDPAAGSGREKPDTDPQLDGPAPVRVATEIPARVQPRDRSATGASSTRAEPDRPQSNPDVQVRIGRVAIEIHQPEGVIMDPQPSSAPDRPGTPGRSAGSSESRLRRLYLRGF